MEKNMKNIAGVSLIEVIIGMLIISLVLIAVAAVFPRMSGHGKQINEADRAKIIGMEAVERLQDYTRYDTTYASAGCLASGTILKNFARDTVEVGSMKFFVEVPEDPCCDLSACSGMNTIKVKVSWPTPGRPNRTSSTIVTGVIR